jgi:hypothetical protein
MLSLQVSIYIHSELQLLCNDSCSWNWLIVRVEIKLLFKLQILYLLGISAAALNPHYGNGAIRESIK